MYVGLGDRDRAFAFLEKGLQERDEQILTVLRDPRADSLRSDPRFAGLLRRAKLPS